MGRQREKKDKNNSSKAKNNSGDSSNHNSDLDQSPSAGPAGMQPQQGTVDIPKDTLDAIFSKLSKLDVISQDIKLMKTDLDGVVKSLEDTKAIAEGAMFKASDCEEKVTGMKTRIDNMDLEMSKLRAENKSLKEQMIKTESQERRNNLILDGCEESIHESKESCLDKVYTVFSDVLKITNARDIAIDRCHRLASSRKTPKPIIFKVHKFTDRETIWHARKQLKGSNMWLSEDYPIEIKRRRQILEPVRRKAVDNKMRAVLSYDRLIIDGTVFTVDTIDNLPPSLHPKEIATRRSSTHTGFFGSSSPLSNFYQCNFKDDDGLKYSSSEQFYQYQKAVRHNDHVRAKQILECDDPGRCKSLGGKVFIPDLKVWEDSSKEIMFKGCLTKFTQNSSLKDFLLSTGDTVIIEANPKDQFWSVGLSLQDPNLFKPASWSGSNNLGKILRLIRDKLSTVT